MSNYFQKVPQPAISALHLYITTLLLQLYKREVTLITSYLTRDYTHTSNMELVAFNKSFNKFLWM